MLITGGAGFIGVNSADSFAERGWRDTVIDNLSRRGAAENLRWLQAQHAVAFFPIDIRDCPALSQRIAANRPAVLLHLAAQVAVTTSVENPREDFAINALGTFNVLEAAASAPGNFDLESELGTKIALNWEGWRPGDQPVFVCDTSKAKERLGWAPEISVPQGVQALIQWVRDHRSPFEEPRKGD